MSLGSDERAAILGQYNRRMTSRVPWSLPLEAMSGDYPLGTDGLNSHLVGQLEMDPELDILATVIAEKVMRSSEDEIDIDEIWSTAWRGAAGLSDEGKSTPESNRKALRAMALLANANKIEQDKLPDTMAPDALKTFEGILEAHKRIKQSTSPDASVLSRGVPPKPSDQVTSVDHNYHFFSHAYLAADGVDRGYSADQAKAISGFAGVQYELSGAGMKQGQGNAAIKDVLMNGEGAQFGADLMLGGAQELPGQCGGPIPEDRSFGTPAENTWTQSAIALGGILAVGSNIGSGSVEDSE